MIGTKTPLTIAVIGLLLLSACVVAGQSNPAQEPVATATSTPIPTKPPPADTPPPPTATPPPTVTPTPAPTPVPVTDTHVVYHGGEEQDGVWTYEERAIPWMDLLVRLGDTWYGPEREPDDGIDVLPLPEGYRWECDGVMFGCHPNGEAWHRGPGNEGTARLYGPEGEILVELPLKVAFRKGDWKEGLPPLPQPTSTPEGGA